MGLKKHVCQNCNNVFKNYFDVAKFCSKNCFHEYKNKNRIVKICPYCNKEFYPHDKGSKYCSKECRDNSRKKRVECVCENCGNIFYKQENQYDENKRHFCSKKCWNDYNFWTEEEVQLLRDNYLIKTNEEISTMLGGKRTASGVKGKAMSLGLGVDNKWTEEEINILIENYETKPMDVILTLLPNRTKSSIIGQARKYKLISYFNLTKQYSNEEDAFIKKNYNKMSNIQIASILNRTPDAICCRLNVLNLHREKIINYKTLSEYIRKRNKHWKERIIKQEGNYCRLTNSKENIVLHHIYGFSILINDTVEKLKFPIKDDINDYTQEELDLFYDTFCNIQSIKNSYIIITDDIHKLFHNIYGYGNNTEEQWNEFVKLYKQNKL